jgi:hypothetical protein
MHEGGAHSRSGDMYYGIPLDEQVPSPPTFAFNWISGLLLYGTPNDDGHGAWDTWILTHPDLRLATALSVGVDVDDALERELTEDGTALEHEVWDRFAPALMASLRGPLPDGLDPKYPLTALRHTFPEGLDRQMIVFVPGVRGEFPPPPIPPFGLTVERHLRTWRVVSVQREWEMPEWFPDAEAEVPGPHEP